MAELTEFDRDIRPDEEHGFIYVDLNALVSNYTFLRDQTRNCSCAAVVKANAYGLGILAVANSLWEAGCRTFFVATPVEAMELRSVKADAEIYVLDGLFPQAESFYSSHNLRPVLNSRDEIRDWARFSKSENAPLPAAIHIDTGMNRLGLGIDEISEDNDFSSDLDLFDVALVMSHLACGDDVSHPMNALQLERFKKLQAVFTGTSASLANSAGILLGSSYHFDLVRPGIALYGSWPMNSGDPVLNTVMHLYGRLIQVRTMEAGESVGYGADYTLSRRSRVATLSVGYADGYIRALGANNQQ
ncbi:MAG: alanine racemase, partial [Methyloligellaceae bacterium]